MSSAWNAVEARLPGRDRELDRLEQLAASPAQAPFVVIRGDAGIGKTALWRAGVKVHRAAGHRILAARPAEEELAGPMVALGDLFDGVDPDPAVLAPDADPIERGRAVLRSLRALAADRPVLVAVDDVQWCDPISAAALRYALRRLDTEPVAVLATERAGARAVAAAPGPVGVLPTDRTEAIDLGPLPLDAIRQAIDPVVGTITRPALRRIHELSGGNPLYATELARTPGATGDRLGAVAPRSLGDALAARLAHLDGGQRQVLRVSAALGPAPAKRLAEVAGCPPGAVTAAVDADLLAVGDDLLVRVAHPLLASVALAGTNPLDRQALHGRLADVVTDPDDRARHLALSAATADGEVAAELEAAAQRAARRGAPGAAAEFAAHALRLSPPGDPAAPRRALAEVAARAGAGETGRALALNDALVDRLGPGPDRVHAVTQRVFLDFGGSDRHLARALADAGDDAALRGRVLELQGFVAALYRGRLADGMALAEAALGVAVAEGDAVLEVLASGTLATASLVAGHPRPDLMDRAMALAEQHERPPLGRWPQVLRARHCLWGGRLDEARRTFSALATAFSRTGLEFQRPYQLADRARLEVASGNLAAALELGEDAREAAADAGNDQGGAWVGYPIGLARAHRGDAAAAQAAACALLAWGDAHDNPPRLLTGHHVRGVVALAAGDGEAAVAALAPALELARRSGHRHPGYVPFLPDAVEAAALAGDAPSCAELAGEVGAQAADLGEPWVDAAALRARGLVALVAGDDQAADLLGGAAAAFDELGYRLDGARARLLQGRALRRAGQRRAAADALDDARARFAAVEAAPWVALAEAEAGRVAPERAGGRMTPTEARIAELVVAGRRNREIAAELFVSVATVEAHLTRLYRKLGVRSRTELSLRVSRDV